MHQRRKRVGDRIAGDAEDARRLVEMLDAIEIEQRARGHLARRGLGAVAKGGEGERRAGPRAEHAAHEAFFAHGDADHMRGERAVFNQPQHGEIVGQGAGGRDDFDEIGLEGLDAIGRLFEAAWCA